MTGYVISNSQTTTETLSDEGDNLLVTGSGSIIVTIAADGVVAGADDQEITVDGLVYAINEAGVIDDGRSDRISVGSQGVIDGGEGLLFFPNVLDISATDNSLLNAGDVSGSSVGVLAEFGGGDLIDNSGQISGATGVALGDNVAPETVENSGTITGGAGGTSTDSAITTDSSAGVAVVNSGLLTDDGANAINSGGAVLYFDDSSGTTSTIDNTGSIIGSGYVIQSLSDILDISNSGTIHGGLYSTATVDVDNSEAWNDQAGSTVVFLLDAGSNSVTNAASGTIDGEVSIAHSHDTVNNAGAIDGLVSIAAGSDTFTNAGTIDGQVMFWSTGTGNSMTNSGSITGDVTLPGSSSAANHGQIYGDVILGASDTLINTGTIHGNVTLGSIDTFDVSPGIVTGAINASTNDVFEFGGDFGKVTFDDFVAGSGPTHDTIQFAANDFSTFSQVQAASTQQGPNVVIKLDATDSITLNNVTLASLVSADFTFV